MATSIHLVIRNFEWLIEGISPTNTTNTRPFRKYDPIKHPTPKKESGWMRKFYVEWLDSEADSAATNVDKREAWHIIRVNVNYPEVEKYDELQEMMLQDRHDLITTLRLQANRLGYDDDNSTSEVGLYVRLRGGDAVDKERFTGVWRMSTDWRCKIHEVER